MPATLYCTKVETDNRGNEQIVVDRGHSHDVTVWEYPQRGAIAQVPGDQQIRTTRIGYSLLDNDGVLVENVTIESEVVFADGSPLAGAWSVMEPPAYHSGTRQVRHWSAPIKERP